MTAITKCAGLILIKCSTPSFALLNHWIGVHCTMKLCDFQVTWIHMHTGYKLCTVCLLKSWIRLRLRGISWVSTGLPPWRLDSTEHINTLESFLPLHGCACLSRCLRIWCPDVCTLERYAHECTQDLLLNLVQSELFQPKKEAHNLSQMRGEIN